MTVAPLTPPPATRARTAGALLDGAVAGVVGATVLILWSVALDLAERRDPAGFLWVPDTVIDPLVQATRGVLTPAEAAIAAALLLYPGCVALGAAVAWLLTLIPRMSTVGGTLMASFAALLIAFFVLDRATGGGLLGRQGPWSVIAAAALAASAMTLTLRKRRPRLIEGRRDLWDDEP